MAIAASTATSTDPRAGFGSLDREVEYDDLPVEGQLPAWLTGTLVRTGPARYEVGDRQMRHWFDGLAMLHRFGIDAGRVSYANRFLETRAYRAAADEGRIGFGEFATDPCRTLFQRVQSLFTTSGLTDNANVNVGQLGKRFVAMTEAPLPVEFDPHTLAAAGVAYRPPGQLTTAHPHLDRATGGMLNYAARLGPRSSYRFFAVGPDRAAPRVVGSIGVREPSYMHSFGLTERWLVLVEFPLVVNPLRLAVANRPYIENYRWKPELGTRLTLVDRRTGKAVGGFATEPCFAFHHVNAYEADGAVVVDVCAYPDAGVIEDLYLDRLRAGKPIAEARLTRFVLDLGGRSVQRSTIGEGSLELPRINYGRHNERAYRFVWGNRPGPSGWLEQIVRLDVETGATHVWSEPGAYPGEPVFVARPGGCDEDDGVLVSVVLDAATETSFLAVLDAASLAELGRAVVPHHIPFGFHGQFVR